MLLFGNLYYTPIYMLILVLVPRTITDGGGGPLATPIFKRFSASAQSIVLRFLFIEHMLGDGGVAPTGHRKDG